MILSIAAVLAVSTLNTLHSERDEQPPVELRYHFSDQDSYRYTQTKSMYQSQLVFSQITITSESTETLVTRTLEKSLDDDGLLISDRATLLSYDVLERDDAFSYDVNKPEDASKKDDERLRSLLAAENWPVEFIMEPRGEIRSFENIDELTKRAQAEEDEATRDTLLEEYSEQALHDEYEPFLYILPEEPVTKGDQWTHSFTIDGDLPLTVNQTMTVKGIIDWQDGKYVNVEFEGDIDFELPADFPAYMNVTKKTVKGGFIFNTHLGTYQRYWMKIEFDFSGTPNPEMGEILISSTLTNNYELEID